MSKNSDTTWRLPMSEFSYEGSGSTSTHRKKLTKASRAVDSRAWQYRLVHEPSQLEVVGEIPEGNYSRKEMQQRRTDLWDKLFAELEKKVARHLKIPRQ